MKIAYVINSAEGGGASQPIPAIARVLQSADVEVRVFALTQRDLRGLPAMIDAGLQPMVRSGGDRDHLSAMYWLQRELRAWGATHIWTSLSRATILGLVMGPLMGLPVISWQHAAFLKPWNRRLMRLLQSRALLWIGDSQSVTALTSARLHVSPDRLRCWPIFACDVDMPKAAPWQPGEDLRIGSLGRLHPVKGYDVLIEALSILKRYDFTPPVPFSLSIAGEGADRARLEGMIRENGLKGVHLCGYIEEPRRFLSEQHFYVQPSRSEGFCIAAHEAMATALPVVASAVGELPYSIGPSTGITVPPADPVALAHALRQMISRPDDLAAMGEVARADMLERLSWERFSATGSSILDQVKAATLTNGLLPSG